MKIIVNKGIRFIEGDEILTSDGVAKIVMSNCKGKLKYLIQDINGKLIYKSKNDIIYNITSQEEIKNYFRVGDILYISNNLGNYNYIVRVDEFMVTVTAGPSTYIKFKSEYNIERDVMYSNRIWNVYSIYSIRIATQEEVKLLKEKERRGN